MNRMATNLVPRSLASMAAVLLGLAVLGSAESATANESRSAAMEAVACRGDFDGDGQADLAVAVPIGEGVELFMFLAKGDTISGGSVFAAHEKMILICNEPDIIQETTAGDHAGKAVPAKHSFVTLLQPEVSSFAFFWDGDKFTELQTAD